jgi:hypothetical protein
MAGEERSDCEGRNVELVTEVDDDVDAEDHGNCEHQKVNDAR